MATTNASETLSATENYGKAVTAFNIALTQAASKREQAMIDLGGDFTIQGGKVVTPGEGATILGEKGFDPATTRLNTGFGEGAMPTIAKTQAGAVNEQQQALLEKGVGATSGLASSSKLITQDQGALETEKAIQGFQATVAEAAQEQAAASDAKRQAAADLSTAQEEVLAIPGKKKKPTAKREEQLASARAAANQAALKAGKPLPYGKGGKKK